jgi:hypothetical protein
MAAPDIARALAKRFFEQGQYLAAGSAGQGASGEVVTASADALADVDEYFEEPAFAGLSVQAVGYEKGAAQPKIHIYLTKSSSKAEKAIENHEGGAEIRLHRVGRVQIRPQAASSATHRGHLFLKNKRVACGSSCGPAGETLTGTLGALVKKKGAGGMYVLSNNHVLAAGNHVTVGMPILAPSTMDAAAGRPAPREVAQHSEIVELRSGQPTLVACMRADVAIARVADPALVSSWQGDAAGYDTPTKIAAPSAGTRVKKFGRTTGLTSGTVEALINTPMPVPVRCRAFSATVYFEDVWTVQADAGAPFVLGGDSGSLVVSENEETAVGLVFAQSSGGEVGYMVPLDHIAGLFGGLSLVAKHGA